METLNKQFHIFKKWQFYAYLAGFIDGDGSIMVIKNHYKRQQLPTYSSCISITVRNKEIIDFFYNRLGGWIRKRYEKYYEIVWKREEATKILMRIGRLLVLKAQQARMAIELQLMNKQGSQKIAKKTLAQKDKLYQLCSALNKKQIKIIAGPLNMKQDEFYAYLAGIIDSEGCISVRKVQRGIGGTELGISNTQKELISFIKQRVGCGTYTERINREEYTIRWYGWSFIKIARKIEKFLIIKKNQLIEAMKFQDRKGKFKAGYSLPLEEVKYRKFLMEKIKDMKRAV